MNGNRLLQAVPEMLAGWLASERRRYRLDGDALDPEQVVWGRRYFPLRLLRGVRVVHAEAIDWPDMRGLGIEPDQAIRPPDAMTFIDTIVVKGTARPRLGLLFHELVHVVQCEALGVDAFAREYLAGALGARFVYEDIPLEAQAIELQSRYERLPKAGFRVRSEVRRAMSVPWR
jgi:hypothetical protein